MTSPAPVADEVLSWLYRSLGHYRNADRTYSDIARALYQFQSTLSPCTENYTYEQGTTALLLKLKGTLPISFLGNAYKLPISIWIPQSYPQEAPVIFFNPNKSLVVRPSQYISVEGKVYHPYLAQWPNHSGRSNLLDCLSILQDVFGKEPPLIARQTQAPGSVDIQNPHKSRYASPSLFAGSQAGARASPVMPPAPPPKPPEARSSPPVSTRNGMAQATATAPPLPPKPGVEAAVIPPTTPSSHSAHLGKQPAQSNSGLATPTNVGWYRPPPQQPAAQGSMPFHQQQHRPIAPGTNNNLAYMGAPPVAGFQAAVPPVPAQLTPLPHRHSTVGVRDVDYRSGLTSKPPVQDLMSMPSEMSLPSEVSAMGALAAPPIPPNPEKDALLRGISATLRHRLEQSIAQNMAAIPALEAQQRALQQAMHDMQHETYQLDELNKMLTGNEKTLRDSMLEADRVVSGTTDKEPPPVDDILVAPTLVGEQLYKLVADERSIGEVLFALTKAMDKGRISSDVFIRQTRSLAREQFLQKALIKKVARGMGLLVAW